MSKIDDLFEKGGTLVVRTQAEAQQQGIPGADIPPGQMLVAVFLGTRPNGCEQISIGNIREEKDRLVVEYQTTRSELGSAAFCSPCDQKLVPFSTKEVVFEDTLQAARQKWVAKKTKGPSAP